MLPGTGSAAPVFSPDETIVATATGSDIGLWDVESGLVTARLPGHRNGAAALAAARTARPS